MSRPARTSLSQVGWEIFSRQDKAKYFRDLRVKFSWPSWLKESGGNSNSRLIIQHNFPLRISNSPERIVLQ
jgi:hypothetical protein